MTSINKIFFVLLLRLIYIIDYCIYLDALITDGHGLYRRFQQMRRIYTELGKNIFIRRDFSIFGPTTHW